MPLKTHLRNVDCIIFRDFEFFEKYVLSVVLKQIWYINYTALAIVLSWAEKLLIPSWPGPGPGPGPAHCARPSLRGPRRKAPRPLGRTAPRPPHMGRGRARAQARPTKESIAIRPKTRQ